MVCCKCKKPLGMIISNDLIQSNSFIPPIDNIKGYKTHIGKTTFDTSDGHWYSVHDDIFKEENWEMVE